MTELSCEVCGGDNFHDVHQMEWSGLILKTVLCKGCGLVFHNPPLEDADREDAGVTHAQLHVNEPIGPRQLARNERRVARQWPLLQDCISSGLKVIEIGCSIGSLSHRLQQAGAHLLGIEPDSSMAEYARHHYGIDVITGRFEQIDLANRKFELAVASHVIEHFVSPSAFLSKLRSRLSDSATLFIETPNIIRPKVGPFRVFSAPHNYHFSPMTLRWLLQKCGFAIRRLREFRHDSIQALADVAAPSNPCIDSRHAHEVLRAIEDHKRNYHRKLMFITRKIPVIRDWWAYRYVDHAL